MPWKSHTQLSSFSKLTDEESNQVREGANQFDVQRPAPGKTDLGALTPNDAIVEPITPQWSEKQLQQFERQKPALGKTGLGAETPGTFDVFTESAKRGLKEGLTSAKQGLTDPFANVQRSQEPQDYISQLLNQGVTEGYNNPDWWVAHITRGLTESSPTLGTGLVGALGGGAIGGPVGGAVGGAGGLALGSIVQTLAPAYQAARAEGLSHEDAVDRAMQQSRIAGLWSGAMGLAPGASLFGKTAEGTLKRPISEALAQIFGVQPALVAGQQTHRELAAHGELPTAEQLGTSMAEAAGMGAVLTGAHAAGRGIYRRANAPGEPQVEVLPPRTPPEEPLSFIDLIPDAEGVYGGAAGPQRAITQPRPGLPAPKGGPEGLPPEPAPGPPITPPRQPSGGQETYNARQEFAQRLRELKDTTPGPVRTEPETTTVPWSREVGARPSRGIETTPKPLKSIVDFAIKQKPLEGFYSPAQRALSEMPYKKAPAGQWKSTFLKRPEAAREAKALGLDIWLEEQGKGKAVTKEEVNNWLKANEIQVLEEKQFTGEDLVQPEGRVSPYGENYTETILKLPGLQYTSPHFDENEVVAVTHSDREGPNGENYFGLEHVQSDIHQRGRTKGYITQKDIDERTELKNKFLKLEGELNDKRNKVLNLINATAPKNLSLEEKIQTFQYLERLYSEPWEDTDDDYLTFAKKEIVDEIAEHDFVKDYLKSRIKIRSELEQLDYEYKQKYEGTHIRVPDAPFKDDLWWQLGFKWALGEAVKNGYDGIVLPTPKQMAGASGGGMSKHRDILYGEKIPKYAKKYIKSLGGQITEERIPKFEKITSRYSSSAAREDVQFLPGKKPEDIINQLYDYASNYVGTVWTKKADAAESLGNYLQSLLPGLKIQGLGSSKESFFDILDQVANKDRDGLRDILINGYYRKDGSKAEPILKLPTYTVIKFTPELKQNLTESGQPLFAKEFGKNLLSGAKKLGNKLTGSKVILDSTIENPTEFVRDSISQGKSVELPDEFIRQQFDILEPHLDIILKDVKVGILSSIKPFSDENVLVTFKEKSGKERKELLKLEQFLDSRAFFQNASRSIYFTHLQLLSGFENSLVGELWHENIHALRSLGAIPAEDWSRLLSHFGPDGLGIIDLDYSNFARAIKHPNWQIFNDTQSIRKLYEQYYAVDPARLDYTRSEIEENLNEEYIAHGIELYIAGGAENEAFAPIMDIIGRIKNNTYKAGKGQKSPISRYALEGGKKELEIDEKTPTPVNNASPELKIPEGYSPPQYKTLEEAAKSLSPLALDLFDSLKDDKWIASYISYEPTITINEKISKTIKGYIKEYGDQLSDNIVKQLNQVADGLIPQPEKNIAEIIEEKTTPINLNPKYESIEQLYTQHYNKDNAVLEFAAKAINSSDEIPFNIMNYSNFDEYSRITPNYNKYIVKAINNWINRVKIDDKYEEILKEFANNLRVQKPLSFSDLLKQQKEDPAQRHYTFVGKASGGTKPKEVWVDEDGKEYMFKPVPKDRQFLAHSEAIGGQITKLINPDAPEIFTITLNNRLGTLQEYLPNKGTVRELGLKINDLNVDQIRDLQREQIIDWLISNHDSHDNQFLVKENNRLIGIDKGQAFKHLGQDKLSIDYHPNAKFGEKEPIYNTIWREYKNGGLKKFRREIEKDEQIELSFYKQQGKELQDKVKELDKYIADALPLAGENTKKAREDIVERIEESDWFFEIHNDLMEIGDKIAKSLEYTPPGKNFYYIDNIEVFVGQHGRYTNGIIPASKDISELKRNLNTYASPVGYDINGKNKAPLDIVADVIAQEYYDYYSKSGPMPAQVQYMIDNLNINDPQSFIPLLFIGNNPEFGGWELNSVKNNIGKKLSSMGYDTIRIGKEEDEVIFVLPNHEIIKPTHRFNYEEYNKLQKEFYSNYLPEIQQKFNNAAVEALKDIFKDDYSDDLAESLKDKFDINLLNYPETIFNSANSLYIARKKPGTLQFDKLQDIVAEKLYSLINSFSGKIPNVVISQYFKVVKPDKMSPDKLAKLYQERTDSQKKLTENKINLKSAQEKLDNALFREVFSTIDKLQKILDNETYRNMLLPYAQDLFKGREAPVEAFINYALQRKNNLIEKFYNFYISLDDVRERAREGMKDFSGEFLNENARNAAKNIKEVLSDFKDLTAAEITAIRNYTGSNFVKINGGLRKEPVIFSTTGIKINKEWSIYADYAHLIKSGLEKVPPYTGIVYRRESNSSLPHIKNMRVGQLFSNKQFFSSTTTVIKPGAPSVVYKIKSLTGRYVDPISVNQGEMEVLFVPNSIFLVTKILIHPGNKYEIHLREMEHVNFEEAEKNMKPIDEETKPIPVPLGKGGGSD